MSQNSNHFLLKWKRTIYYGADPLVCFLSFFCSSFLFLSCSFHPVLSIRSESASCASVFLFAFCFFSICPESRFSVILRTERTLPSLAFLTASLELTFQLFLLSSFCFCCATEGLKKYNQFLRWDLKKQTFYSIRIFRKTILPMLQLSSSIKLPRDIGTKNVSVLACSFFLCPCISFDLFFFPAFRFSCIFASS